MPALNYSNEGFAGFTRNTSVRRESILMPVTGLLKPLHDLIARPLARPCAGAALGMAKRETYNDAIGIGQFAAACVLFNGLAYGSDPEPVPLWERWRAK